MKAMTRRGGGGAVGGLPAVKKKRKDRGGFMWGCGGSKSVSVAAGNLSSAATTPQPRPSSATATAKPASAGKKLTAAVVPASQDGEGPPSVDTLLRQLRELERGVRALGVRDRERGVDNVSAQTCRCSGRPPPQRHRRSASDVWGGGAAAAGASARARKRLEEESVAVVTETVDPLGDFRRSMAEMVVENGITGGPEMRELLQRFLSLNSACHHHFILLAFADVWQELYAGSGDNGHPHASKPKHLPYHARSSERAS